MNTLPEHLINKIMLYVSHPCADMLRNCSCERFEEDVIMLKTQRTRTPNSKFHTMGFFVSRDDGTKEHERIYESEVVERNIINNFKLQRIDEDIFEQLKK